MTNQYYLMDKCGDNRYFFGPYTLRLAQKEAGNSYVIVTGRELENAMKLPRGVVRDRLQSGSIVVIDEFIRRDCVA